MTELEVLESILAVLGTSVSDGQADDIINLLLECYNTLTVLLLFAVMWTIVIFAKWSCNALFKKVR